MDIQLTTKEETVFIWLFWLGVAGMFLAPFSLWFLLLWLPHVIYAFTRPSNLEQTQ